MINEQTLPQDILNQAKRIYSMEEMSRMPEQQSLSLFKILSRILREERIPTPEELLGVKEMVEEHLWHPGLSVLPKTLQTSQTSKPETSESQSKTEMLFQQDSIEMESYYNQDTMTGQSKSDSALECLFNEVEDDGLKAGTLRILRARHQSEIFREQSRHVASEKIKSPKK